jgi:hypothetical protein
MTSLGSKVVYEMTPELLKEFAKEVVTQDRALNKAKPVEQPMNRKAVSKFLNCHINTVDKNWKHLRHMTKGGTPYWYASEIDAAIRKL